MGRRSPGDELLPLVQSYFCQHLRKTRGASPNTVMAYRDSLRMFLCFLADVSERSVADVGLADILAENVLGFLEHLETERGNSRSTRNARLAAIRSFAAHLLRHDPIRAGQYQQILSLPTKKARRKPPTYLEPEQVKTLLRQPDLGSSAGQRDRTLILFLYNTGARVSEALNVQRHDLHLVRPFQVRLRGKGNKDRFCPLWRQTANAIISLISRQPDPDGFLFLNARGQTLTRDGAAYIVRKYAHMAAAENPSIEPRNVSPHVLRHSCAVALLQAGIDFSVIRDYLGHESIATTSHYVSSNLELKRQVMETFWQQADLPARATSSGKITPEVLALLDSL